MAGTVTAAAGEIGGFEIEPKALKKSVFTDGQVTASVVLSPDTGSHNSLLFRMNAERNNGNATIYEIVNTKPANDSFMIENFGRVQGNFRELDFLHDRSETRDLSADLVTSDHLASGSFIQRIYIPQGADSALPGKVEQRLVSQESGSRSRIIQSVESLGLGQTHAKVFFDGHTGAVSASNQIFTSTGNLAQTNPTPQRNGKGIVFDSFGAIGAPGEAIPGVFMGSTGSYFRYMGRDGADVLQISSSNFILDAGSLLTPKLEIEGKITATSGDISGFSIQQNELKKSLSDSFSTKIMLIAPSTGSDNMSMIRMQETQTTSSLVDVNLFEVSTGQIGTFPQQTIFGAFKTNKFQAPTGASALPETGVDSQRDYSTISGSYLKILNDSDNLSTRMDVIVQSGSEAPFMRMFGERTQFGSTSAAIGMLAGIHLGGYPGAVSGSYGIGSGNTTGMGFNVDTLLLANGEIFPGVFFGHQGHHGAMKSYVSFVGKSSLRGIEIDMGKCSTSGTGADPHLLARHIPGSDETNEHSHFQFNLSGSSTNTTIIGAAVVGADKISVRSSAGPRSSQYQQTHVTTDYFTHNSDGIGVYVNNAYDFLFKDGGDFHADADVLAFSATISDERLKDDVKTIEFALDKINNLRGVEYVWNRGGRRGEKDLGVIAQEVEKVIPEIVRDKEMPLIDDSEETYKTVDYEKLTAVLIEGMKEQQKQIDELKREVKELKDGSSS